MAKRRTVTTFGGKPLKRTKAQMDKVDKQFSSMFGYSTKKRKK